MSALDGYVQLQRGIKIDPEFTKLSPAGQWLYFQLLTDVNHIGVADWYPNRLAMRADACTESYVKIAAKELTDSLFAVLDERSGEILIRSYMKYDGAHKQPNTCTSMVNAFGSVASIKIKNVVSHELAKIWETIDRQVKSGRVDDSAQKSLNKRWNILERIMEYPPMSAADVYEPAFTELEHVF
jgi:hypothetical protein